MASQRYIWRLEHHGFGPWRKTRHGKLIDKAVRFSDHGCDPSFPPEPAQENGALGLYWRSSQEWDPAFYFGFRSLAAYKRWFNTARFRDNLAHFGGELVRYRVDADHVIDGEWQLIFKLHLAERVACRLPNAV